MKTMILTNGALITIVNKGKMAMPVDLKITLSNGRYGNNSITGKHLATRRYMDV